MMKATKKPKIEHEVGSRNVFADIGLSNAEEHLIKAQLVHKIDTLMGPAASSRRTPLSFSASGSPTSQKCSEAISGSSRSSA
jgi:hypothetical protein